MSGGIVVLSDRAESVRGNYYSKHKGNNSLYEP